MDVGGLHPAVAHGIWPTEAQFCGFATAWCSNRLSIGNRLQVSPWAVCPCRYLVTNNKKGCLFSRGSPLRQSRLLNVYSECCGTGDVCVAAVNRGDGNGIGSGRSSAAGTAAPHPSPAPTLRNTSITKATGHLFRRIPGMRSKRMQPANVPPAAAIRAASCGRCPPRPFWTFPQRRRL